MARQAIPAGGRRASRIAAGRATAATRGISTPVTLAKTRQVSGGRVAAYIMDEHPTMNTGRQMAGARAGQHFDMDARRTISVPGTIAAPHVSGGVRAADVYQRHREPNFWVREKAIARSGFERTPASMARQCGS